MIPTGWWRSAASITQRPMPAHSPPSSPGITNDEQLPPHLRSRAGSIGSDVTLRSFSGGMLYIENDFDVVENGRPVLWFDRDDEGYALLNVRMPQASSSKSVAIETTRGSPWGTPSTSGARLVARVSRSAIETATT